MHSAGNNELSATEVAGAPRSQPATSRTDCPPARVCTRAQRGRRRESLSCAHVMGEKYVGLCVDEGKKHWRHVPSQGDCKLRDPVVL